MKKAALVVFGLLLVAAGVLFLTRTTHPMLYYYGASPETPTGAAFPILNPFRDRADENNADYLLGKLRSDHCVDVVREYLPPPPDQSSVCALIQGTTTARLVWMGPRQTLKTHNSLGSVFDMRVRRLIYDIPERHARVTVVFTMTEVGFIPTTLLVKR